MKPMPSQRAHHVDSGGIFSFHNGLHMRKLRCFDVLWKQAKKDCTVSSVGPTDFDIKKRVAGQEQVTMPDHDKW